MMIGGRCARLAGAVGPEPLAEVRADQACSTVTASSRSLSRADARSDFLLLDEPAAVFFQRRDRTADRADQCPAWRTGVPLVEHHHAGFRSSTFAIRSPGLISAHACCWHLLICVHGSVLPRRLNLLLGSANALARSSARYGIGTDVVPAKWLPCFGPNGAAGKTTPLRAVGIAASQFRGTCAFGFWPRHGLNATPR